MYLSLPIVQRPRRNENNFHPTGKNMITIFCVWRRCQTARHSFALNSTLDLIVLVFLLNVINNTRRGAPKNRLDY